MKCKIKLYAALCIIAMSALSASAWGRLGHDAVAGISEKHLTPRAKANIERYLGNHSIVYYASWMDWVRQMPHYNHSSRWHASNVDSLGVYYPSQRRDAVEGCRKTFENLRRHKEMTDSAVADNIKLFVHIVGDMHCPGHAFYTGYDQKNIYFKLNGKKAQVHDFWDNWVLDQHPWQYKEYVEQLDRFDNHQIAEMQKGTPEEWATESGKAISGTYGWFENGRDYDKAETYSRILAGEKIAHERIVRAGYRLARLLNEVFDY